MPRLSWKNAGEGQSGHGHTKPSPLLSQMQARNPDSCKATQSIRGQRARRSSAGRLSRRADGPGNPPGASAHFYDKENGYEQVQIFIEPKGSQLVEQDGWKEEFLLQMKEKAVPVKPFMDDNDYRVWGMHFFNEETRGKEFEKELKNLLK